MATLKSTHRGTTRSWNVFSAASSQFNHIQKANKEEDGMLSELPSEPLRWRNYAQTPVLLSPPSHPGQRGLTALERWKWSSANLHRTGGGSCESASSELCQEFAILLQNNPTGLHTPRQTPVPSPVLLNTRKIACWMMLALLQRVCVMVQMECHLL